MRSVCVIYCIMEWNGCFSLLGNDVISNDVCWDLLGNGKCQVSISVPTSHSLTHSMLLL